MVSLACNLFESKDSSMKSLQGKGISGLSKAVILKEPWMVQVGEL